MEITVQPVRAIPLVQLTEHSAAELISTSHEFKVERVRQSPDMWVLSRGGHIILIAGMYYPNLIAAQEVWALVAEDFRKDLRGNIKGLREFIRVLAVIYPRAEAPIPLSNKESIQFAKLCGLREVRRETNLVVMGV